MTNVVSAVALSLFAIVCAVGQSFLRLECPSFDCVPVNMKWQCAQMSQTKWKIDKIQCHFATNWLVVQGHIYLFLLILPGVSTVYVVLHIKITCTIKIDKHCVVWKFLRVEKYPI